ncbi:hypothetical protein HMF8227_02682 [Saliniradius amylolyticus]|uniref:Peptidase M14 domain-containing protein n=1 Tax=Saliniradius amylolyticus TaxID=2183582 RepID=A0A2S2E648_9ALTE|nr:M14 family zinc carboxypeptidase [Saliniradius amylolyticus]AWL13134.1 hypothetical protein HMF8227_02682 [Saliniradius amylolyticus]
MQAIKRSLLTLSLLGISALSHGAPSGVERISPEGHYQPETPRVETKLGYPIGSRISSPEQVHQYFQALQAAHPERIQLIQYGQSWEGRPLYVAVLSSAENLAKLDDYKTGMQALADPRQTSESEARRLMKELPASVWLSYGVHGNEISSPEAAMMTAYHLLGDTSDKTQQWLDNTLVFIVPSQNPDGRARFVSRYYMTTGLEHSADRRSAEHNEPWPKGRTNHYLFDLNRDWISLTQPEIRSQARAFLDYYPLVFVDLHEMSGDSSYYFTPEARPYNPLIADPQRETLDWIGRNNGKWFDAKGFDFFTREIYDAFYPGYGASWPLYHGSVAMTYEMASARGHQFRQKDGDLLTYADGVERHFIASLSTIETVSQKRTPLLEKFWQYRQQSIEAGEDSDQRSLILPAQDDPAAARKLASLLVEQGIEVEQATQEFEFCGEDYAEGAYVIDLAQPTHRLIRTLTDKQIDMADDFLDKQRQRRHNNLPDQIYDVTGWSLPQMFNLQMDYCDDAPDMARQTVTEGRIQPGKIINPNASVAFLVRWGDMNAGRFLTAALRQGLSVKQSEEAFRHDKAGKFAGGSLILTLADNPREDLLDRLQTLVQQTGATLHGVNSSWVVEGPSFGSPRVHSLYAPTIAMAWDQPVAQYNAGNTRFVIERQMGYPVMAIRTQHLVSDKLDGLDVLILPETRGSYDEVFDEKVVEKIQRWVKGGGVLLTLGNASGWAAKAGLLDTKIERAIPEEGVEKPAEENVVNGIAIDSKRAMLEEIRAHHADPSWVSGALVNAEVDPGHWLSAGVKSQVTSVFNGNTILAPIDIDKGRNIAWFSGKENLIASGFLWDESKQQLPYKPLLVWQPAGDGMIISFTQVPTYRAQVDGLNVLLMNALFLAPAVTQ